MNVYSRAAEHSREHEYYCDIATDIFGEAGYRIILLFIALQLHDTCDR